MRLRDFDDDLNPARGILRAAIFGLLVWALIYGAFAVLTCGHAQTPIRGTARTSTPTAVGNNVPAPIMTDKLGRTVTANSSIPENYVSGSAAQTGTAQTSLIAAQGASIKLYITDLECGNSGVNTSMLTFTDTAATALLNPAGFGFMKTFATPLVVAANTAFQFTPGSASTTQTCNAQGYIGP